MKIGEWIDPEDFNPGYLMRNMHLLPKAGDKPEVATHPGLLDREKDLFPTPRPGRSGFPLFLSLLRAP